MFKKIIDIFFNRHVEKNVKEDIFLIPISGQVIDLDDVPDEVFSKRMMGAGFAIKPENGDVFSPVDGTVVGVFPTKHAIAIKSNSGVEILIHFGMDTVKLNGEGFTVYMKEGNSIKAGDILLRVNLEEVENKVPSIITPVIFTNLNEKNFSYSAGKFAAKEKNVVIIK